MYRTEITSRYHWKHILYLVSVAAVLVALPGYAQNIPKKIYASHLDTLWSSNVFTREIAPNGKWVIYSEVYDNKENVLTLKNTENSLAYTFQECNSAAFSNNSKWFGGVSSKQGLILVDLVNHTKKIYPNIASQAVLFSKSGNYLAAFQKKDNHPGALVVVNLNTKEVTTIPGATTFQWHPVEDRLLLVKEQGKSKSVVHYNAGLKKPTQVSESSNSKYRFLNWSNSGNAVFIEQQDKKCVVHYMDANGTGKVMDEKDVAALNPEYRISNREAYISNDGKKILFYRQLINEPQEAIAPSVEVWNSNDPWIYPRMQYYKERELRYVLTAWYPKSGKLVAIETEQAPTSALDSNHDFALVYNQLDYEPQYKFFPNADLYVKNLKTGNKRLVTKNQYTEGKFITISPNGRYISYFKDSHWWVYNVLKNKTVNVTRNIPGVFENREMERPGDPYPFGNPGWLDNEEHIVLYDKFDIWIMTPDGKKKRRITQGKENNIRYRISKDVVRNDFFKISINQNVASAPFKSKNGLLLEMVDYKNHTTGYALWQKENPIKTIVHEDLKVDNVLGNKDLSTIVYRKQKCNQPIGIYCLNLKTNEEKLIYQSNEALLDYDLGKTERIEYTANGKSLKGALVYPANFNPDKKYPMIVHIYEKESKEILNFNPPSNYGMEEFNLLKYTTNGYFVFYPDFSYTIGDPGFSALNSVTAAVNKVLLLGYVDKKRIGLIGHSFGGYETAFIISQTDMFATAVAGAAVTEPVSFYHNVFWDMKMNQMWRMENQQWRMGTSFYKNKNAYYRNSPIHHIENIKTPLLLWAGKLDSNVNWSQSVAMFMGLKRLNKKAKMLLFNKEPHALMQKENQQTLSREIFDWMESHLKKNKR